MNKDFIRLAGTAAVLVTIMGLGAAYYNRSQEQERAAAEASRPRPGAELFERPHSHSLGPKGAKVTIVEFLDPECESCRAMYPLVKKVIADFPEQVRLVLRYVPLHPNSVYAAGALEAAAAQGRFWDMLEVLLANQPAWGSHHQPRPELIPTYAQQIGLDMQAFEGYLANGAHKAIVETDFADARALGVAATPTFFVNGRRLDQLGYDTLRSLVEEELAKP